MALTYSVVHVQLQKPCVAAVQEGLEVTCRNDSQCGFGAVQLGQELDSHHPFGKSPECHTKQSRVQDRACKFAWQVTYFVTDHMKPLASGCCMSCKFLYAT